VVYFFLVLPTQYLLKKFNPPALHHRPPRPARSASATSRWPPPAASSAPSPSSRNSSGIRPRLAIIAYTPNNSIGVCPYASIDSLGHFVFASTFAFQGCCAAQAPAAHVFGYEIFPKQANWDQEFMKVPSAKLAGEELKILTSAPHWASSPEDYKTAEYVAEKFRAAGLHTEIQPFRVWLNKPVTIEIEAFDANGKKLMSGPTPEHVDPKAYGGDPFQNDPRILPAFNGSSPSGDVTADVRLRNYGTQEDFKKLASLGVSIKGKIVLVRYGGNFRGVKVYIAQQYGAPASSSTPTPATTAT
jgi:hypothetical protein